MARLVEGPFFLLSEIDAVFLRGTLINVHNSSSHNSGFVLVEGYSNLYIKRILDLHSVNYEC